MIKQDWSISLDEKKRILNLHESATKKQYLILEQENNNALFTVNFEDQFKSGQYNLNPTLEGDIRNKIEEIANFIKNKKITNYKIQISPGESQVPNQPPFQEVGSLAKKRGEVLKAYLTNALDGFLGTTPEIIVSEPKIGKTQWIAGKDNKDDPRFKAEQFVKVSVVIDSEKPITRKADYKTPIYLGNVLVGYITDPTVNSKSIEDSGILPFGKKNPIFTEIEKDTVPIKIRAQYEVPWEWWNQLTISNSITPQNLEKIRTFKKL